MKALFIIHDVYQNDNLFPLGPGYLASILRENDYDVDTYCMDVFHYTNEQLKCYLRKREYDMIGIGFLSGRFVETVLPLCKVVNEYKKKARVVLGGHGASATPEYILETTEVDSVIVGEAENVISNIKDGINYSSPVKDLDMLPFPAWDLFPMKEYVNSIKNPGMEKEEKSLSLISSRGCPNNCRFCYRMEKGLRLRSIDNLIEEMKILYHKYGVTYFDFSDDFFAITRKRLEEFSQALKDNNLKIKYLCESRVKGVNEEILELMKSDGCCFINYGFESTDADVLKEMNKNTTPEDNENAAKLTKESGIPFGLNMLWNNPGDTVKSLYDNVKFIKKYNMYGQVRTIKPVTPFPVCPLYYQAIEQGLLSGIDDFYQKFKNTDLIMTNFTDIPLEEMYKELFKANSQLLKDHYLHSSMGKSEYEMMKNSFYQLYFKGEEKFRGVRRYDK